MNIKSIRVVVAAALLGVLAGVALISVPASAAGGTQSAKEKVAISAYSKTVALARAAYFAQVKPSRDAVRAIGKPAELRRRAAVAAGLAIFSAMVRVAKAPSLAAESAYRSAAAKSAASPGDTALKSATKARLADLNKATAALRNNPNVAAARLTFAKVRAMAMAKFKATISASVSKRSKAQVRAMAKFKATKTKALARLRIALKAARAN